MVTARRNDSHCEPKMCLPHTPPRYAVMLLARRYAQQHSPDDILSVLLVDSLFRLPCRKRLELRPWRALIITADCASFDAFEPSQARCCDVRLNNRSYERFPALLVCSFQHSAYNLSSSWSHVPVFPSPRNCRAVSAAVMNGSLDVCLLWRRKWTDDWPVLGLPQVTPMTANSVRRR